MTGQNLPALPGEPAGPPQHRGWWALFFGCYALSDGYDLVHGWRLPNLLGPQALLHGLMAASILVTAGLLLAYRKPAFETWFKLAVGTLIVKVLIRAIYRQAWLVVIFILVMGLIALIAKALHYWLTRR